MATTGLLKSVRVLDLTRVWAGPLATRMLGDFGAEVVKIGDPRAPSGREGGINNKLNRNKQGLALRLDEAAGKQLFLDLVSVSDVVVENFRPRVMRNFGLTYDVLRGVRPDLIMCSMPGFGTEGEYAEYPAFGPSVETMTGITSLMGYPGGPPQTSAIAYPDAVAGMNSVGAIMTALWHRRRTGHGQFIDLALSEGPVCQIGEQIVAFSRTAKQPARHGNNHPDHAPYGCYPAAGDDQWIAVCVASDAQWKSLREALGDPTWARIAKFAGAAGRVEHREQIDAHISAWTANQDAAELARQFQSRGIAAGPVLNNRQLLEDPHMAARGYFVEIDEPDVGPKRYPGQAIRMSSTPASQWTRAALQGEHTSALLKELLATPDADVAALTEQGVVGVLTDQLEGPE